MRKRKYLNKDEYGGFILTFEPARTDRIEEYLADYQTAAESFSAEDWAFEKCELVFLARREPRIAIFGAALMRKMGGSGGTRRTKMRISNPVIFIPQIDANEAGNAKGLAEHISTAENLKRINPIAWLQLIQTIKNLRENHAAELNELVDRRLADRRILSTDPKSLRISEQRDAVGLVLEIAEIDRRPVLNGADNTRLQSASTILDILDMQPVAERSLIEHDSRIFGLEFTENVSGSAIFPGRQGNEVRIYVVDSTPLETATGVDLMIYNQMYNSFLLLQYKAMEKDSVVNGWSYKVDGSNIDQQLETIHNLKSAFPNNKQTGQICDQRLNDDAFYFKFCERTRQSAREDSLSPGLTINAHHLQEFLSLPEASSEGHGRRIGYKNTTRYLSNSEFIALGVSGILCKRFFV
ncbi:hypothetical protein ACO0LM_27960 [Undibacterium sp. Di26W]|uniref:hypothetical protein n=1 Tax=Undibacterium sp. Di26W TaxID=3413035 RepID=UPI003BF2C6DE